MIAPKSKAIAKGLASLARRFDGDGTAAEIAYAVLREAILSNVLTPGTRLRADDVARELGVSKTPVREALRKLQAEDFVVTGAGNALTVKVLSERQLLEIYYTREALEGMAARLAAENAGQLDVAQLRAVVHDVEVALGKSDRAAIRNYTGEFQLAVFKAAHNDFLFDLLKSLQEKIRNQQNSTISMPGRDEEVVVFCRDLSRAIEAHDPDAAERIARANRRRTLDLHLKMMRSSPTTQ
jgi:DNA-binding GntR family transcriptional regulator